MPSVSRSEASGKRIINIGWGGQTFSHALLMEVNRAKDNDMLIVAAAGDRGTSDDEFPSYPASFSAPNIITVAATDNRDQLYPLSSYGPTTVHLGAPGVDIRSAVLALDEVPTTQLMSGTAMAAAHVAGAAALILSKCSLTTTELKAVLLNNVDHVASLSGRTSSGGRLNVFRALNACMGFPKGGFTISTTVPLQTVTAGSGASYNLTVTPFGGFSGIVNLSAVGVPAGMTASESGKQHRTF